MTITPASKRQLVALGVLIVLCFGLLGFQSNQTNFNSGGNSFTLLGFTWAIPGSIGSTTPNSGAFTTVTNSGTLSSAGDALFKSGRPWVDVRAYGAKGDGTTDDTAAIQSAANVAKNTNLCGTLFFPASPTGYLITTSLDLTNGCSGLQVLGVGPNGSKIECNLGAAFPCLDFTGSHNSWIFGLYVHGNSAGSQTAAILNARQTGTNKGDFATIVNTQTDGKFSRVAIANVSADNSNYREDTVFNQFQGGFFFGCTDVLGVGSAYQTFSGVTGCTQFIVDASLVTGMQSINPAAVNLASISQTGTTLTLTATSPSIAAGQSFTISGSLSTTATTLTALVSSQGIISGTTSGSHGLVIGDRVKIAGVTPAGLNGIYTVATVPLGTTFTLNGGNGLADLTGTIFGTVTRTWDEDYVAATSSGSAPATITATLGHSVTDTGSVAGTVQLSSESIRIDGVANLAVNDSIITFAGNQTAFVRTSGIVTPSLFIRGDRLENNNSIPFTHVVDAYSNGIINSEINGRFNVLGSLFRVGVGQTINNSRFNIRPAGSDSTELLFDGMGNVSLVDVIDAASTSYSFNIGASSGMNQIFHPTGKTGQFTGNGSILTNGNKLWLSGNNTCVGQFGSDTCSATGYLNFPNNKAVYWRNAANNADVFGIRVDGANNVQLGDSSSNAYAAKQFTSPLYLTTTNCLLGGASGTASPAACTAAPAGKIAIPASQTTYTVNTTAAGANSTVIIQQTNANAGIPSAPACSATVDAPLLTAINAGASFTFSMTSVAAVMCYEYWVIN